MLLRDKLKIVEFAIIVNFSEKFVFLKWINVAAARVSRENLELRRRRLRK